LPKPPQLLNIHKTSFGTEITVILIVRQNVDEASLKMSVAFSDNIEAVLAAEAEYWFKSFSLSSNKFHDTDCIKYRYSDLLDFDFCNAYSELNSPHCTNIKILVIQSNITFIVKTNCFVL
jgi:hypothetical protein